LVLEARLVRTNEVSVSWIPRIGAEFAGYRLDSLLGHGGMSIVYRAEHLSLGRTVALKLLEPQLSEDESFRERFARESRLAAGFDHPNVVPIYEAGEEDGVFFIAMRYVEGSDLKARIKRDGPLDPERTVDLIGQVASALNAAHQKGLIHRDVKPANILLASGHGMEESDHVYLSDFGVAKQPASDALTKTGMFVGTAEYAAPEQIEGQPLDGRADIYALGCVLYECLTGDRAYDKDSEVALMYAHLLEPPPSVTAQRPDLPPEIDDVVSKAMAKSRDERYATARDLAADVRRVLLGERTRGAPTIAPPAGAPGQETVLAEAPPGAPRAAPPPASPGPAAPGPAAWAKGNRRKLIIGLVAAALIAAAAIAAILLVGGDGEGTAAKTTPTETAATTPQPPAPASLVEVLAPTQIAAACTSEAPRAGAVETDACTPREGAPTAEPDEVELSFFPSGDFLQPSSRPLEKAYASEKGLGRETRCGTTAGERVWIHQATGKRGGRRVCLIDDRGNFVVVWTHEKLGAPDHVDMLGIAREPGRSPASFRSWWTSVKDNIGKCRPKVAEDTCLETIERISQRKASS
jgi:hypothetical protein